MLNNSEVWKVKRSNDLKVLVGCLVVLLVILGLIIVLLLCACAIYFIILMIGLIIEAIEDIKDMKE